MTPYHLRHSLGTLVVQATKGDLLKAQLMLDHADSRTTLRYVQGAGSTDVMRSAVGEALAAALLDSRPAYVKPSAPAVKNLPQRAITGRPVGRTRLVGRRKVV